MASLWRADPGAVQDTANDAVQSKASAAALNYFSDPYVQLMCKRQTRRAPLINRGYYTRVAVVRDLVRAFIRQSRRDHAPCQVVSLGGGFDTLYFTLHDDDLLPNAYVEIDFAEVIQRKHRMVQTVPALLDVVGGKPALPKRDASVLSLSSTYHLVCADLRDLITLDAKLDRIPLDRQQRTLLLSECVLVYMHADEADAVVKWARDRFCDAASVFVLYEQILPNDPFGQTMRANLERRGCPLLSIEAHPTLHAQQQRFLDANWAKASALDMNTIYERVLDRADVQRIEKLELFDEFEEYHLIQAHYCVTVALSVEDAFTDDVYDKFSNFC